MTRLTHAVSRARYDGGVVRTEWLEDVDLRPPELAHFSVVVVGEVGATGLLLAGRLAVFGTFHILNHRHAARAQASQLDIQWKENFV